MDLEAAVLTTNAVGNASGFHVFTPADAAALPKGVPLGIIWTMSAEGGTSYASGCESIVLDPICAGRPHCQAAVSASRDEDSRFPAAHHIRLPLVAHAALTFCRDPLTPKDASLRRGLVVPYRRDSVGRDRRVQDAAGAG